MGCRDRHKCRYVGSRIGKTDRWAAIFLLEKFRVVLQANEFAAARSAATAALAARAATVGASAHLRQVHDLAVAGMRQRHSSDAKTRISVSECGRVNQPAFQIALQ